MIFVIPMAGRGSRFKEAGFEKPKFMLSVCELTLLEWSLKSLPLELAHQIVFVGLAEANQSLNLENTVRSLSGIPDELLSFCWLDEVTNGQATTVLEGLQGVKEEEPLVIFNIDTTFLDPGLSGALQKSDWDGLLGSFHSQAPNLSYAALDAQGEVTEVAEKEVISSHALNGLYAFRSVALFRDCYQRLNEEVLAQKGEVYVAPLYNYLLQEGRCVRLSSTQETYPLGTPEEVALFKEEAASYCEEFKRTR